MLPGDFVYREGATVEEKVAAIEAMVRKELKQNVTIRRARKSRDVIVVRGTLNPNAPTDDRGRYVLELGMGEKIEAAPGAPSAYMREPQSWAMKQVFEEVENMFEMHVVDESGSELSRVMVKQYVGQLGQKTREEWLAPTLASLMKQTGLEFEREKRELDVWEVTEEKK
jgi:hypothetical protein